jgi:hypothetical protein
MVIKIVSVNNNNPIFGPYLKTAKAIDNEVAT